MGDEDRVVVVEIAIAHAGAGDMRLRVVAGQFHDAFVAGHHAVDGQREALEHRLRPEPGKDMRRGAAFVIAALRAHVMEARGVRHVHFHHLVEPRRGGTVFEQGHLGAVVQLDDMVQDRVGSI